ncbi:hypothetical protein ACN4DJ_06380 [Corynebacterium macclintockiae]|uniref:hypothetical protein n=1 Tax=Corynebacterium macclintockiae TaxID=2913501 RepID=UPI003EC0E88D
MSTDPKISTLRKPNGNPVIIRARRDHTPGSKKIFLLIGKYPYLITPHDINRLTHNLNTIMEGIHNDTH